jgi:lipoprotein-releasing system permease protein
MNIPLIPDIAISLLRARLRQSIIAAAGVTFGIGMFITLVSFMNGLNQLLDNLILNRTPHIRLYNEVKRSASQPVDLSAGYSDHYNFIHSIKPKDRGKEIYNSKAIIKRLHEDPRVYGVAPKLIEQVFFNSGSIEIGGIINGVDVANEEKLFSLSDYVIKGDLRSLMTVSNSIFIGKGIADKMMLELGDRMQVTSSAGQVSMLKIEGIIQFGISEIDDIITYTSLQTAQKLLGKPDSYITEIQIKLHDLAAAPETAKEFARTFELDAIDIQAANSQFDTGSRIRSIISYAVGVTLLIVAGFGIYNILNMLIYEKMDAIAILKATGFSGTDVKKIFIYLSLIIGVSGGILGLIVGYVLSVIISHIPFETASLPTIETYPVYFSPTFYVIGMSFALFTTYMAGLFPARKASKVDPVTIIRGK